MAAPLLVFSITRAVEPVPGLRLYEVCVENPDLDVVKAAYSVGSALVQYLAPIAIVSVAHAQIRNKLRTRMGAAAAQPRPTRAASEPRPTRATLADQGSRARPGPPWPTRAAAADQGRLGRRAVPNRDPDRGRAGSRRVVPSDYTRPTRTSAYPQKPRPTKNDSARLKKLHSIRKGRHAIHTDFTRLTRVHTRPTWTLLDPQGYNPTYKDLPDKQRLHRTEKDFIRPRKSLRDP